MNTDTMLYKLRENEWVVFNDIEIGDRVLITRTANRHEGGWDNSWEPEMDREVGKIGTVRDILSTGAGIVVETYTDKWDYPYFVLEKVGKSKFIGFLYGGSKHFIVSTRMNEVRILSNEEGVGDNVPNKYATVYEPYENIPMLVRMLKKEYDIQPIYFPSFKALLAWASE